MGELDEEAAMMWQDVLDEIAAGRPRNLRCPFCLQGEISVTPPVEGEPVKKTRVECKGCKRFIEVKMADVIG